MKADFEELDSKDIHESEDFDEAKNNFKAFINDIYESEKDLDELESFIEGLKDSVNVHVSGSFTLKLDSSEIIGVPVYKLRRFTNFKIVGIQDYRDELRLRIRYKG